MLEWIQNSEHVDVILHWLKGAVEEVFLVFLVCDLYEQTRSHFIIDCMHGSRRFEAIGG